MAILKKLWNYAASPFCALAAWFFFQTFFSVASGLTSFVFHLDPSLILGLTLALSSVCTIGVLMVVPFFGLRRAFSEGNGCSWRVGVVGVAGALLGAFGCDLLNEACHLELPDNYATLFATVGGSVWGVVALTVLGPLCEELVFRGGVMRPLLRQGVRPWVAIGVSAVLFGLLHGNLAQGFFAMLLGILFGILYYRTGNLLLSSLCHILNNSISVALMLIYGGQADDMQLSDLLGGTTTAFVVMIASLLLCILLILLFWRKTGGPRCQENRTCTSQEP